MSDPTAVTRQLGLPHLLTVPEVAAWLQVSVKAVYTMIARGEIGGVVRVGRRVRIRREHLLELLQEERACPPKEIRR